MTPRAQTVLPQPGIARAPRSEERGHKTSEVDDAEDGEVVVYEPGRAAQDAICSDFAQSPEAMAIGEGFSDYFAASLFAAKSSSLCASASRPGMRSPSRMRALGFYTWSPDLATSERAPAPTSRPIAA